MTAETVVRTGLDGYVGLLDSLRSLLDELAGARLDDTTSRTLGRQLDDARATLAPLLVDEAHQTFARRFDLPDRGQTLVSTYAVLDAEQDRWSGSVAFGRYHLGRNGAVHGGSLTLFFEDLIGQLAISAGRTFGRAAYTHVDFRALTPVGAELTFRAWFVSEVGRKRLLRAEVRDGDTLCAEAEGLVIELRSHQH